VIATEADIPMIVDLCREAHVGSVWEDLDVRFDAESTEATIRALMENPNAVVMVSERGTLWLMKFPVWFNHAETMANEVFFYATEGGDALRREGQRWAGGMLMTLSRHEKTDDRLDRLYERGGFTPLEHTWIRRA
jgi:hypothetical protein